VDVVVADLFIDGAWVFGSAGFEDGGPLQLASKLNQTKMIAIRAALDSMRGDSNNQCALIISPRILIVPGAAHFRKTSLASKIQVTRSTIIATASPPPKQRAARP
jgi:hypothetical protein